MTRVPTCPHCNSPFYAPDPSNGGAGRNKCLNCGVASPVAHWYVEREPVLANLLDDETLDRPAPKLHPPSRAGVSSVPRSERKPAPIRQYKDD